MSAGDPSEHLDLEPTPEAARRARGFLAERLPELDPDTAAAVAVCASELVTNGVLHARTRLRLGVTHGTGRVFVTVGDGAPGRPEQPPPDDDRPSGRGILLVDALSDAWGVHDDEHGKTVWFTVAGKA